jgi:hypothetical protein
MPPHSSPLRLATRTGGICLAAQLFHPATQAQELPAAALPSAAAIGALANHPAELEKSAPRPAYCLQVNYSYAGEGDVSYHGDRGQSDAHDFGVAAQVDLPLDEHWFVPVSAQSKNLWLETISGVPIPDEINTLSLGVGAGYHFNDQWTVAGSLGPTLYRFSDFTGDDIGFTTAIHATYRWRPDVLFAFGLAINPDSEVPVLPLAGARWNINPDFTLSLMFPRPALIYHMKPQVDLMLVGSGEFATFRTESDMGSKIGQIRYNHTLGTYRNFHLGCGAEYRFSHNLSASFETGYAFGRQIDYKSVGETVTFDPSPYVTAGLRWRF